MFVAVNWSLVCAEREPEPHTEAGPRDLQCRDRSGLPGSAAGHGRLGRGAYHQEQMSGQSLVSLHGLKALANSTNTWTFRSGQHAGLSSPMQQGCIAIE